ncbi:MAG: hypothetical protein IPK58_04475 [Acidobacteria bacterium]|nr:hypothetical protein [Acidobacteriota bacterium]
MYLPENNLGAPPGQTEKDSDNAPATLRVRHRPGAANFNFSLPLAGISGRGISAAVGMTYNSRTWNKSVNSSNHDHFVYDVEKSWIAPGFASGFGYLETSAVLKNAMTDPPNNNWHTEIMPSGITDPDGTRRFLECKETAVIGGIERCTVYGTSDGSYIRFNARSWIANPNNSTDLNTSTYANADFSTIYPNGTRIWYSGGFGSGANRKHYPIIIQDRNGNRIRISYKADGSAGSTKIRDTLNRDIKFHYENDSNGNPDKLVALTIPGMSNEEIQTVRFYYETMTLQSGGFVKFGRSHIADVPDPRFEIRLFSGDEHRLQLRISSVLRDDPEDNASGRNERQHHFIDRHRDPHRRCLRRDDRIRLPEYGRHGAPVGRPEIHQTNRRLARANIRRSAGDSLRGSGIRRRDNLDDHRQEHRLRRQTQDGFKRTSSGNVDNHGLPLAAFETDGKAGLHLKRPKPDEARLDE